MNRTSATLLSPSRLRADERGQLVALFTLGMFTLLLFVSLSMNVGQAVVRRHQAQVIADTGALAGAAVQARGLNQITRVNAVSLRLFNTLQMRSRIGGYHEVRPPLKGLLAALLAKRKLADDMEVTEPAKDENTPAKVHRGKQTNIVDQIMKRIIAMLGFVGRDDYSAFGQMEPWFAGARTYMRTANVVWEFRARQVARDVGLENVKALVGDRTAARCRGGGCVRPAAELPSLKQAGKCAKGLYDAFKTQRGSGKRQQSFKQWVTSLKDLRSGKWLDLIEACDTPRLVKHWENPDGDILIIRYWTDLNAAERLAIAGMVGPGLGLIFPPSIPFLPIIVPTIKWGMELEYWLRRALAPKWHDMRVTLHRRAVSEGADPFDEDTHFVFWAKLPTTPAAMKVFYPFADLPEIMAVAAAKPVGGSVGAHPQAHKLERRSGPLKGILKAISRVADFGQKILPENEHVFSRTVYGTGRVQMRGKGPIALPRTADFHEEKARMMQVFEKDELAKMGFDDPETPHSLFWYVAPQFPYYEPRLVPLQEAYMKDVDLSDDAQARLRELYGLKAKKSGSWPF